MSDPKLSRSATRPLAREVGQAAEAAAALMLATVAIRFLPFRGIVGTMGSAEDQGPAGTDARVAAEVRAAVKRAAGRLPWRIVCFHEGLATHWMLRRRGQASRLHYGLKQGGGKLSAHVWITLGNTTVIGEEAEDPHVCIAVFPR